uniref:(northern house mosquito) hypothetical protein n=1 Tax=Culex pipiens TaxID=7175 RepID=A0A8D8MG31_CULPI
MSEHFQEAAGNLRRSRTIGNASNAVQVGDSSNGRCQHQHLRRLLLRGKGVLQLVASSPEAETAVRGEPSDFREATEGNGTDRKGLRHQLEDQQPFEEPP